MRASIRGILSLLSKLAALRRRDWLSLGTPAIPYCAVCALPRATDKEAPDHKAGGFLILVEGGLPDRAQGARSSCRFLGCQRRPECPVGYSVPL